MAKNLAELKVGDRVLLEPARGTCSNVPDATDGTVEKIGRTYIYVRPSDSSYAVKFEKATGYGVGERGVSPYWNRLYLSEQAYREFAENLRILSDLREMLSWKHRTLADNISNEKLKAVAEMFASAVGGNRS